MLPVELPEITDFEPEIVADDADERARSRRWRAPTSGSTVELDLPARRGRATARPKAYRRERTRCRSGPGRAGTTCATSTRRTRTRSSIADGRAVLDGSRVPGGVDLYVGGVEHAVLHLLYARFWHKVLFDLGHVSTPEPFQRLFNQGYIQAPAYIDERGFYVEASEVEERDGAFTSTATPRSRASTGRWARA